MMMSKILALSLSLLCFNVFTKAQDKNSTVLNELSLFAGPIYTDIRNDNINNDKYADSYGHISYNLGLNYCFYFNKNLGLNFGAEYNQYQNSAVYKGAYRSSTSTVDRFNYIYYPTVESNYTDTRAVNTIDIPINLRLMNAINDNFDWFIDLGIKLNAIIINKLNQNGTFMKKGSYPDPQYNNVFYVIENDTYYGYTTTVYGNTSKQVDSKNIGYSIQISTGFKVKINEKTFLSVSGHYMSGKSDVGPMTHSDYQNLFGQKTTYSKYTLFQAGMKVGIGFKMY